MLQVEVLIEGLHKLIGHLDHVPIVEATMEHLTGCLCTLHTVILQIHKTLQQQQQQQQCTETNIKICGMLQ
jgi:hypothetical protein